MEAEVTPEVASVVCARCQACVRRTSPTQRYCPGCSEVRDLERKRLWARARPRSEQSLERRTTRATRRRELAREAGVLLNTHSKERIDYVMADPDLLWYVRVAVPFSYALSKNHLYTTTRHGHVALRREARAARAAVATAVRSGLSRTVVAHNKVWIDIFVQKPDHKGDAINVVDVVCDALKEAMPVDDRWFCIRRLDWEVAKVGPRIFIGIGQDSRVDSQVCSHCGRILPCEAFPRKKSNPLGVDRVCRECRRHGRSLARGAQ